MKWNFLKSSKNQYEKENNNMKMRLQLEIFDQNKSCILKDGRNIFLSLPIKCGVLNQI